MTTRPAATSVAERVVIGAGGLVICMDAVSSWLVISSDCMAIFGLMLWAVGTAAFVLAVLLPGLVAFCGARLGRPARWVLLAACVAVALPIGLFSLQDYPNIRGCIS